jgi:endoglucanase Acf2
MKRRIVVALCALSMATVSSGIGQTGAVRVGAGGYILEPGISTRLPAPPEFRTANVRAPVPSGAWWSSLVWEKYSGVMVASPLSVRASADGLALSHPKLTADSEGFAARFTPDLGVGLEGTRFADARLDGYGDWTVDALWQNRTRVLRATFGHGLPYVWFRAGGAAARVAFLNAPEVWSNAGSVLGVRVNGRDYAIFTPAGTTWRGADRERVTRGIVPYLVVAALPDMKTDSRLEALKLLREHAFARPTKSDANWRWNREKGEVEMQFSLETQMLEGASKPSLMGLFPHQWQRLESLPELGSYTSARGEMKLLAGDVFTTRTPYTGILPVLPAPDNATARGEIRALLEAFVTRGNFFPLSPESIRVTDAYTDARNFGRLNQLVFIAEQLGAKDEAAVLLKAMRGQLEEWLSPDEPHAALYDKRWGTLIPTPASHGADYQLNDHHFNWGYFLHAAATIVERDPDWLKRWGGMMDLVVRDVAASRGDKMFTPLRQFDLYEGHSWASGDNRGRERGANQESSSEAVNFAAGLIRWAQATHNDPLLETGVMLYALETDAVWAYWFRAGGNFPANFPQPAIGILWGDGGQYGTWWTNARGAIHLINALPFTGASLYLARDAAFVDQNRAAFQTQKYWPDLELMYGALTQPDTARETWTPELRPEFGSSRPHTLHWLESLRQFGTPVQSVTADTAQFAVFDRNGTRIHVAFNPTSTPRTVNFSDGTRLETQAHSFTVQP